MGFNFWESFVLNVFTGLLSALKHSPQDVPKFKNVLVHILNDVCALLGVQAPTVP